MDGPSGHDATSTILTPELSKIAATFWLMAMICQFGRGWSTDSSNRALRAENRGRITGFPPESRARSAGSGSTVDCSYPMTRSILTPTPAADDTRSTEIYVPLMYNAGL